MSLIRHLGGPHCQALYSEDPASRLAILRSLASGASPSQEAVLPCNTISQALCLICLKFPQASEEEEPLIVAGFLCLVGKTNNPLPTLAEQLQGKELLFCAKTLVTLAIFRAAISQQWERRGAPSPQFYRKTSQSLLNRRSNAHKAVSSHHTAWENFLFEQLN